MKKLVGVLMLAVISAGCQSHVISVGSGAQKKAAPAPSQAVADSLPVAMLQAYDLSPVLRTLPADPDDIVEPMNDFFGADHYRIELVVSHVERVAHRPTHYLLRGKSRYKGCVAPFVGEIELAKVQRQPNGSGGMIEAAYTALGNFELREVAHAPRVGIFRGRVAIDWAIEKNGQLLQYTPSVRIPHSAGRIREFEPSTKTPTLGGGILYDGTWTSAAGQIKPVVWAADILTYHGPQVLSDFAVGGRMLSVNPKYAKLGWNKYWENDEWWADSPKPTLHF